MNNNILLKGVAFAAMAVGALLMGLKVWAYWVTNSVSVLSSLLDSMLDVAASAVNFLAIRKSLQPANTRYRYGHGKFEAIAGIIQSTIIAVVVGYLFFEAVQKIWLQEATGNPEVGIYVLIVSLLISLLLIGAQTYAIKKTGSLAIRADSLHYKTDLLQNGAVIALLYFAPNNYWLDAIVSILIGGVILVSAKGIFKESLHILADHSLSSEEHEKILTVINKHAKTKGYHKLLTRFTPNRVFIEFHIELDNSMTLLEAHTVADELEDSLLKIFPEAHITIHQDPV